MGDELDALRAQRMAQMQAEAGQQQEKAQQQEEMKNAFLSRILDQAARARLNSLAMVKPDKARMVEGMLMNMARQGQVQGKVSESMLMGFLEQVNQKTNRTTKVNFQRRRLDSSSSSEED